MKKVLSLGILLVMAPVLFLSAQNTSNGSSSGKLSEILINHKWQKLAKQVGSQATDISKTGGSTVFKKDGTFVSYDSKGKTVGTGTWSVNETDKTIKLQNKGSESVDVLKIFELNDKRFKMGTMAVDVEISYIFSALPNNIE